MTPTPAKLQPDDPALPSPKPGAARGRATWAAIACLVFSLAVVITYGPIWKEGAERAVALGIHPELPADARVSPIAIADAKYEAWLVSRHAYTLVRNPLRLFQTEHCAPEDNSLVFGIPMITMGILAIPFYHLTGEPILTFNLVLVTMSLIAAIAMYLLVAEWTGVPGAGIVAGLVYSFHPIRIFNIGHPSVWDTIWTVIALLFAYRLFARGRWPDAAGLSVAIVLQIWTSVYPFLAAIFAATPYGLWLCWTYRLRHVKAAQGIAVGSSAILAAAILFLPYLEVRETGQLRTEMAAYAAWSSYLPGRLLFMSWTVVLLSSLGLLLDRKRVLENIEGDPRWALLLGVMLAALFGAGSYNDELWGLLGIDPLFSIPNFNGLVRGLIPGLDSIRGYARMSAGVQLGLCVLAGLGAAGLIRSAGRYAIPVTLLLLAFSAADTFRPAFLGLAPRYRLEIVPIRPEDETVAFYRRLEELGNRGPIFQVPGGFMAFNPAGPSDILLSAFHHRRTSACFGSHRPASAPRMSELSRRLPQPAALRQIRELGFTTLVVADKNPLGAERAKRLRAMSRRPNAVLQQLHSDSARTAYALGAAPAS